MAREDPDSIEVRQLILMSVADGSGLEECAGYSTGVPGELSLATSRPQRGMKSCSGREG
jgi:hypothetical protein